MARWIIFLRGVNVGGNNKLLMADLREALQEAGFEQVQTYIQSGNVILTSQKDRATIAKEVGELLKRSFELEISILVVAVEDVEKAIAQNPFEGDPSRLMFYFCFESLDAFDDSALQELTANEEELKVTKDVVYLHAPEGIGRSKLVEKMDRLIPVQLTARNLRTAQKLVNMAKST